MAPQETDNARLGIILMIGFCALAPLSDALAKMLSGTVPLIQIVFARFAAQLLLVRPGLWHNRRTTWATRQRLPLIIIRSILHLLAIACFFASLAYLDLADALAIAYVLPFFILGVGWLTGEKSSTLQVLLCLVGFIGTLLVVQPSFAEVGWPALLPVLVAALFTGFMFITRQISKHIDPIDLQAANGVVAIGIMVPLVWVGMSWDIPALQVVAVEPNQLLTLLGVGVLGTTAHLLMTWSLRYASAPTVAPVQYLEIPMGAALGWIIFSDFPNGIAAIGIVITIGAGLLVLANAPKKMRQ